MQRDLAAHRRLLDLTYRRYVDADRALAVALQEMRIYFPANRMPYRGTIGAPGSRVRHLHEERERALLRLHAASEKFKAAKMRLDQRNNRSADVLLLTVRFG